MTWTYSGNPASTPTATVRFLVGDTIPTDPLSTDEEIEWALTIHDNIYSAAALVANAIAIKFSTMKVSVKIGPIAEEYGNRAEFYSKMARELNNKASSNVTLNIYAGGISQSDKAGQAEDNKGVFSIGMNDE